MQIKKAFINRIYIEVIIPHFYPCAFIFACYYLFLLYDKYIKINSTGFLW